MTDGTAPEYLNFGFLNPTGNAAAYEYDVNGNMTKDPKKGLNLEYNDLNRTKKITVIAGTNKYINYTYNADGRLIRKERYNLGSLQEITDYIGGFVYSGGQPIHFGTPEGRVRLVPTGTPNIFTFKNEYIISDHQGNARVSFEENGTSGVAVVRQENSYYPFGLIMGNGPVAKPNYPNRKLYNGGAEHQDDYDDLPGYYQTFYRNYDAALGRFIAVDPKAEAAESWNTYQYAYNNPALLNDPMGDLVDLNKEAYYAQQNQIRGPIGDWREAGMQAAEEARWLEVKAGWDAEREHTLQMGFILEGLQKAFAEPTEDDKKGDRKGKKEGITVDKEGVFQKTLPDNQNGSNATAFIGAAALSAGWSAEALDPEPVTKVIGAIGMTLYTGYVLYQNRTYLANSAVSLYNKMTAEIDRISQKAQGPRGVLYALVANHPGLYPNVRGGTTFLNAGDVWKFGETTDPIGRYSGSYLRGMGLQQVNLFQGTRTEIKIQEKIMIYGYFAEHGTLPAGNSIFR